MRAVVAHAFRVLPLLAALGLCAGSATYSTRRAALVPEVSPPMESGAPLETLAEVSVTAPTALAAVAPSAQADQQPGIEVPGWELGGMGRLRVRENFDIALLYEHASAHGARPLAQDQPTVDGGDAYGWGLGFTLNHKLDEHMHVAFIGQALTYSIPWVEYRTCVMNCEGVPALTEVNRGRTQIPVFTFGLVPSWKSGPWTLFGGLSARNQPTIQRGAIETGADSDSDVEDGDFNFMVHAGARLELGGGLSATAIAYQDFGGAPVDYGPTVAFALSYGFGKVDKPAAPVYAPAAAAEAGRASEAR